MCNDYYNKQIFDAVEHINMPDALGTRCYIYRSNELCGIYIVIWIKAGVQKCSLKKYGMEFFFLRYWHQWICICPKFTLKDNFITTVVFVALGTYDWINNVLF